MIKYIYDIFATPKLTMPTVRKHSDHQKYIAWCKARILTLQNQYSRQLNAGGVKGFIKRRHSLKVIAEYEKMLNKMIRNFEDGTTS